MKAYTISKYGAPEEVLVCRDVDKPIPKENEVLLKIRATTVNDYEWCLTTGNPYSYRLFLGLFKPRKKLQIPGMEVAGVVEGLGEKANKFKVGDAVYGDISDYGFGSFAEYLCVNEKALAAKPDNMSFEEATSMPHASMLALQGLRNLGQIKTGQKILINGGGGGVGAFGVQIAKVHQAEVSGVDTGDKLEKMKQQGFDHIIDYKKEDFTKSGEQYDLILDCRTNRSPFAYLRALKPKGKYITVGGQTGKLLQLHLFKPFISLFSGKKLFMVTLKTNSDLEYINQLYTSGKLKCQIDGPYPFEKTPWAVRHFGEAKHSGKVVITVS